jgi:short-subunit dehydrogenase
MQKGQNRYAAEVVIVAGALRVELASHGVEVLIFCPAYTQTQFFINQLHSVGPIKPLHAESPTKDTLGEYLAMLLLTARVFATAKFTGLGAYVADGLINLTCCGSTSA